MMVRSFDKRIESLFKLVDTRVRQQVIHILYFSLLDTVNAYEMHEDGSYVKCDEKEGQEPLNIHKAFYNVKLEDVMNIKLFEEEVKEVQVGEPNEEQIDKTKPEEISVNILSEPENQ